jgi:sulfatase modifying factor 1
VRLLVSTALATLLLAVLSGCRPRPKGNAGALASARASPSAGLPAPPPWDAGKRAPPTPDGMVWIPPGALVAGTPKNQLPRIADEEMEGEQVVLDGFFISIFPYPNEEAAIPLASVTQEQAKGLCEKRGQRLCTELEWERACKGPDNHTYEYGDHYRADICVTGAEPRMLPVGLRLACRSDFGVRDMHGSLWEWTASSWNRGTKEALVAVRGGNSPAGELTGRCANGAGRPPTAKASTLGFRCCSGPANHAEVTLHVERGPALERRQFSAAFLRRLEDALPDDGRAELRRDDTFRISETWLWHPIGNEELVVGGGCTAGTTSRGCGVVVARLAGESAEPLAWASSGVYVPSPRIETNPRFLWIYGGDVRSHYRRLLTYAWGRVALGELQRNVKLPPHRPQKK